MINREFVPGDRVYHNYLRRYGTFQEYNKFDYSSCFVAFDVSEGEDVECVKLNWLDKRDRVMN